MSLYKGATSPPKSVVIVGHSMVKTSLLQFAMDIFVSELSKICTFCLVIEK